MKEILLLPFSILFNTNKYDVKSYLSEFIWLIVIIWLLWTWIQIFSFLFPESVQNDLKQYISWLFSYYAALLPTIFLNIDNNNIKINKNNIFILMIIILVFWTLSMWVTIKYSLWVLIFNIILTIITLYLWVFINHKKFIKDKITYDWELN